MPIFGLTDQHKLKQDYEPHGKPIILGYLKKGKREGFGEGVKLIDCDHFVFTPKPDGAEGQRILSAFNQAYGENPRVIDDVRIDADVAGNFHIDQSAWMIARKHSKSGSIFLAKSDGRFIYRMRDSSGKVQSFYGDERPLIGDVAYWDQDEEAHIFTYNGKPYPFQNEMMINFILPKMNQILGDHGVAIYGVVTLILRGANEIPNIIAEIESIKDKAASAMSNPLKPNDYESARRWMPLNSIPLCLFRQEEKVSAPNYKTKKKADKIKVIKSLVHIGLNGEFGESLMMALENRTKLTLKHVANMSMLEAPKRQESLAEFNDSLGMGDPLPQAIQPYQRPTGEPTPPNFEDEIPQEPTIINVTPNEDETAVEPVIVESKTAVEPEMVDGGKGGKKKLEPVNWRLECLQANTIDQLAYRYFQLDKERPSKSVFSNANGAKKAINLMCKGAMFPESNTFVVGTLDKFSNSIIDGAKQKIAIKTAVDWFNENHKVGEGA